MLDTVADSLFENFGSTNLIQNNYFISDAGHLGLGNNYTGPVVDNSFTYQNNLIVVTGTVSFYAFLCLT